MICFKEWQTICEALRSGQQSLILRKGGIHEGKGGFSFHSVEEFVLFPTRFHAQTDLVEPAAAQVFTPQKEWEIGESVRFETLCRVEHSCELRDWEQVRALAPFHQWTEQCIKDRFFWEGKGMTSGSIHLALLRVYTLSSPLTLPYQKRFGGCRSWVELEEKLTREGAVPVLSDPQFASLRAALTPFLVQR